MLARVDAVVGDIIVDQMQRKVAQVGCITDVGGRDIQDDELMDLIDAKLARRRFRGYKIEGVDIQILARPTKKAVKL